MPVRVLSENYPTTEGLSGGRLPAANCMSSQPTTGQKEQRAFQRYSIERGVHYRGIGIEISGIGRTVNMSRGGVLLAIDRILPRGLNVEVEVDWPVELSDRIPVKLVIRGKIIRSKMNGVALVGVTIASYEFHIVSDQNVACEQKKV
jgi:hypothetical protein